MRILVYGADGMLGHMIVRHLNKNHDVYATIRDEKPMEHYKSFVGISENCLVTGIDAYRFDTITRIFKKIRPDVVINCIGLVKQRKEASNYISAIKLNSLLPHQLAEICTSSGTRLIHFSTDCVFSGLRGNYCEEDVPDPVDLYGRSKLLGELDNPNCLTLRTSIMGWELRNKGGLLEWFAAQRGKKVMGFKNAIYSGLSTSTAVRLVEILLQKWPQLCGLYHASSKPISKFEILTMLKSELGWHDILIEEDVSFICDRSINSAKLSKETGWFAPEWQRMIEELARERHLYEN